MKTKLILLALLVSMCSNQTQENNEMKIISLSTTHTEIIQSLEAENTLVGVDAFSEVDFPVEIIDAYTVTAEELVPLNPDIVIIAFDFNGIVEGLKAQEINYVLLPPAKNLDDVYAQISTIGDIVNKVFQLTSQFTKEGFKPYKSDYESFDMLKGKKCDVIIKGIYKTVDVLGVNDKGEMLVKDGSENLTLRYGEVSIREL